MIIYIIIISSSSSRSSCSYGSIDYNMVEVLKQAGTLHISSDVQY